MPKIGYDRRRNRALADAGVLGVFLAALPLAIHTYWADWNWELSVAVNMAAWVVLLGSLFMVDKKRLRPTVKLDHVVFIGILMVGPSLFALPYQKQQRHLYETSPGCVDTSDAGSSSPTPCVWTPMHVDETFSFRTKNRSHTGFDLKDGSDVTHRVEFFPRDRLLQITTREGDPVEVQFWRGSIVQVKAHGVTSVTTDYPGSDSGLLRVAAVLLSLSGPALCGALFTSCVKPRSRRK